MRSMKHRRLLASGGLVALALAVALTVVPAALNSNTPDGLSAYVVPDTRGPLPASTGAVRHFVHVVNRNDVGPVYDTRETVANAFVIENVELTMYLDGVETGAPFSITAPPDVTGLSTIFTGRWPTTVTGDSSSGFTVGKPAVIPGEDAVAIFIGWENFTASGKYVFEYTLHGTLNGDPVDLTASSPPLIVTE